MLLVKPSSSPSPFFTSLTTKLIFICAEFVSVVVVVAAVVVVVVVVAAVVVVPPMFILNNNLDNCLHRILSEHLKRAPHNTTQPTPLFSGTSGNAIFCSKGEVNPDIG